MSEKIAKPNYGNWVPAKIILYSLGLCLFFGMTALALAFVFRMRSGLRTLPPVLLLFLSLLSLVASIYFVCARYLFSYGGGGLQDKILDLLLERVNWDGKGKALDVGCGGGALSIKVAQEYAGAEVTGIDYWGGMWEYSRKLCEKNAQAEKVGDRCAFLQASASSLPFKDESFDLVVSNLVFHEVKDVKDKRDAVKEALRVLKKGGKFAFQDLFLIQRYFGEIDGLLAAMKNWGVRKADFVVTAQSPLIPKALKLPFMVGTIAVIYGEK